MAKVIEFHPKTRAILLAAICVISSGVNAAVVQVNATFDLTGSPFQSISPATVTIGNGDHVVFTVDFTGNQALTIGDGSEALATWLFAGDNNSSFTIDSISLDLLGFSGVGGAQSSYAAATETGGAAHLGPFWSNFLTVGQAVTFTGFKVEYDVQGIAISPHDYASTWIHYSGDSVRVGSSQSVPEPTSLALLSLGLAGMRFNRRLKR